MGCVEKTDPIFVDELRLACPQLNKLSDHELASWIVSRLNYVVSGSLELEGNDFAHDTNEFGYKIRINNDGRSMLANGAIVIHQNRIYFAAIDRNDSNFQSLFVHLLADSPGDLAEIEIRVLVPETKQHRTYGWDGNFLLI